MHITVFGANGKVGSRIVAEALRRGHKVRAVVHGRVPFSVDENLEIVEADVYKPDIISHALAGTEVVISALGSWKTPKKDILVKGMLAIIPAMQQHRLERLISLTGHDARASGDDISQLHQLSHWLLGTIAPKILRDSEGHIRLLEQSDLRWTVLRSPLMTELGDPSSCRLVTKRPAPWATIHRQSVANTMLDLAEGRDYERQAPYIVRS